MTDYILSCCSTVDLTKEHLDSRDIKYACFHYELDGKQYLDDLGQSMPLSDFYKAMADGAMTKTSQINAEEYEAYFRPFLEQGRDVIHLTLSSGISGTINSANIARDGLLEEFPDRKIYIIDSLAASSGYGLLMDKLADLRDDGMDIDELAAWAEEHRLEVNSKTAGFIGGVLNICPLLNVSNKGELIVRDKIRTKKKVIKESLVKMQQLCKDGADYSEKVYISHSACYEDAKALAELVEAAFPKMKGKVLINDIGTTIGSHTGPGTVALYFWGKKRVD